MSIKEPSHTNRISAVLCIYCYYLIIIKLIKHSYASRKYAILLSYIYINKIYNAQTLLVIVLD